MRRELVALAGARSPATGGQSSEKAKHRRPRAPPRAPLVAAALSRARFAAPTASALEYRGATMHGLWDNVTQEAAERELALARRPTPTSSASTSAGRRSSRRASCRSGTWGAWMRFMTAAKNHNLRVVLMIASTPCWASSAPTSKRRRLPRPLVGPRRAVVSAARPARIRARRGAARARYGTLLAAIEVWNEPERRGASWTSRRAASDYVRLAKATYAAVKRGDAAAPVLAGALSGADTGSSSGSTPPACAASYDGLSFHPYAFARDPLAADDPRHSFLAGIELIRAAQQAAGDQTPIWLTEFGWTTTTRPAWAVSEQQQADYIGDAFMLAARAAAVRAGGDRLQPARPRHRTARTDQRQLRPRAPGLPAQAGLRRVRATLARLAAR